MRRQFQLPEHDVEYLEACGRDWEAIVIASGQWVLLPAFPIPAGYNVASATAAIQIPAEYPDTQLDMICFSPVISRTDGKSIGATGERHIIDGGEYQRWSRHRTGANPWQPGVDGLATQVLLMQNWLAREFS